MGVFINPGQLFLKCSMSNQNVTLSSFSTNQTRVIYLYKLEVVLQPLCLPFRIVELEHFQGAFLDIFLVKALIFCFTSALNASCCLPRSAQLRWLTRNSWNYFLLLNLLFWVKVNSFQISSSPTRPLAVIFIKTWLKPKSWNIWLWDNELLILLNLIKRWEEAKIGFITCVLCANKMSWMHPLTNEPFYVAVLKRCNIYLYKSLCINRTT